MVRDDGYLSARESRRILKENRKITTKLEKIRTRRNVPESEYMTEMKNPANVVEPENLHTFFFTDAGTVKSADLVSLEVLLGEMVGVVGESGYDKFVTSLSLMQLLRRPQGRAVEDSVHPSTGDKVYEITKTLENVMQHLRGNFMSMIFREPVTSLNPVSRIGDQMGGVAMLHKKSEYPIREAVKGCTTELLKMVGTANSEGIYNMCPHGLSGGIRQRVMIATVLACLPKLITTGEPVIALDVMIQAQILDLLRGLKDKVNSSIMLITHDLGVIVKMTGYVMVMYSGRAVETGIVEGIFPGPAHPYTIGLMASKLTVDKHQDKLYSIPDKAPNPTSMPNYCYFCDHYSKHEGCCDGAYPGEIRPSETHRASRYRYDEAYTGSGQSKA